MAGKRRGEGGGGDLARGLNEYVLQRAEMVFCGPGVRVMRQVSQQECHIDPQSHSQDFITWTEKKLEMNESRDEN